MIKRIILHSLFALSVCVSALAEEAVQEETGAPEEEVQEERITAFAPESNLFRSLGRASSMWNGVFTPFIADGTTRIDVSDILSRTDMTDALAGKASLDVATQTSDGLMSSDDKLKLDSISRQTSWAVDEVDNLVTITAAKVGDLARIITGEYSGNVYQLVTDDPTVLTHWLNITRDGGVIAVNGKTGAVEVDLVDFPDVQAALNAKANLASPALTGTPTVPTATVAANNEQIANTAYVQANLSNYLPLAGGSLTGVVFINASTGSITRPNRLDLGGGARLYGLGVFSGGALTFHSAAKYSWYLGNTSGSQTEVAYLNATDFYLGGTPLKATVIAKADAIIGEIRMFPFRPSEFPKGWHFPSGDYVELSSPVGQALNSLPANYKSDWGIVVSGTTIRMFDPNKFFATDGGGNTVGRFFRPVDGSTRLPGSTEDDAIRNITGSAVVMTAAQTHSFTGAFTSVGTATTYTTGSGSNTANYGIALNASRTVPTAPENRPFNVGLTPAVYLGVN